MNLRRLLTGIAVLAGVVMVTYSAAFAQQDATRSPLFAILLGGNEVSNAGEANVGDPNGHGSASVLFRGDGRLCFTIIVNRIDTPTAAHIHRGVAGTNGPIVIPFTAPETGSPGTSSGCFGELDRELLEDIRNNASRYYVNVHTELFPAGAIRGQLF
jgi:hypothetical protein